MLSSLGKGTGYESFLPFSPGLTAVKVTLTGRDTGPTRTPSTNEAGHSFFPLVAPGRYRVSAENEGFKRAVQELVVETGKRVTLDLNLQPGPLHPNDIARFRLPHGSYSDSPQRRKDRERDPFLLCASASLR